jgi:bifunctional non-homologous end joining protein LigD
MALVSGKKGSSSGPAVKSRNSAGKKAKAAAGSIPLNIKPMLATLVDKPFDEPGWTYEVKWDGYRALAFLDKANVELRSRNDKSFNDKFYAVHQALGKLGMRAVLDGEIVVTDDRGHANFGTLQGWRSEADGDLRYYVFDLLWLDGVSLMERTLVERRELLRKTLPEHNDTIFLSDEFDSTGTAFFKLAEKMGLEGIIAKKNDSVYTPGLRSRDWLKIKTATRQEVIIGGYTMNEGSDKLFSSLLVGVIDKGKFVYTGKIGTGFTQKLQKELMKQFKPYIRKTAAFENVPDINKPSRFRPNPPKATATWLKPVLVCEVSYREMTSDGVMRHPSFEGMRIDKPATEVVLETAAPTKEITGEGNGHRMFKKSTKTDRRSLLNPTEERQVRNINGHELTFTNLSKIFWPKEKYTKRDLLNYYYQVAPYMLPYMKDRPQSLNRHPNGIEGKSFYQKDVTGKVPEWMRTFPYRSEGDDRDKNFLVCSDEASLLYIASLGAIEMNPWSSRVQSPDNPDWCIIDLDPDKNSFDQVVRAAQVTHDILEQLEVPSYCKTSGSTGLHIYIPLGAKYNYELSKEFARMLVKLVHGQLPDFTSIERPTANRKGKIYLDFLQNRPQATIAAPYSVRPKPQAPVSMPLHWDEVTKGLRIENFTLKNAIDRLKSTGDLFKPVLGKGIDMKAIIRKLDSSMPSK